MRFTIPCFVLLVLCYCNGKSITNSVRHKKEYIKVDGKDMHGVMVSVQNMLVNFEYKFAFCPIQKSASSLWTQLFLRMAGDEHWYEPPWHKNLPSFRGKLNISEIEAIMNDPTWTKAIFLRDPARRLLSAWFYMIKNGHSSNSYTLKRKLAQLSNNHSSAWSVFLDAVLSPEIKFQDVHWRPQVDFCAFHKFYPLYNFVGNVERSASQGPALLKRIGLWDEYAAKEWSLAKVIKTARPPRGVNPARYQFPKPAGYNQSDCMFCANYAFHETNYEGGRAQGDPRKGKLKAVNATQPPAHATKRNSSTLLFLTNETWHRIRNSDYYKRDYDVFWRLENVSFAPYLYYSYPPPSTE